MVLRQAVQKDGQRRRRSACRPGCTRRTADTGPGRCGCRPRRRGDAFRQAKRRVVEERVEARPPATATRWRRRRRGRSRWSRRRARNRARRPGCPPARSPANGSAARRRRRRGRRSARRRRARSRRRRRCRRRRRRARWSRPGSSAARGTVALDEVAFGIHADREARRAVTTRHRRSAAPRRRRRRARSARSTPSGPSTGHCPPGSAAAPVAGSASVSNATPSTRHGRVDQRLQTWRARSVPRRRRPICSWIRSAALPPATSGGYTASPPASAESVRSPPVAAVAIRRRGRRTRSRSRRRCRRRTRPFRQISSPSSGASAQPSSALRDRREQHVDGERPVAGESRGSPRASAAPERDVDAEDDLVDRDGEVAVAIARAGLGLRRRAGEEQQQYDGADTHSERLRGLEHETRCSSSAHGVARLFLEPAGDRQAGCRPVGTTERRGTRCRTVVAASGSA